MAFERATPPFARRLREAATTLLSPAAGPGRLLALGVFALVAVGLHAGADRLDELAFVLVNAIDGIVDAALAAAIRAVYGLLGVAEDTTARHVLAVVEAFDLDDKIREAQNVAVVIELIVLALLAPALLRPSLGARPAAGWARHFVERFELERVALPVVVGLAVFAGLFVVTREVYVATHALAFELHPDPALADLAARIVGAAALGLMGWLLASRALLQAVLQLERRTVRRPLRGLWLGLLGLPLAALAAFDGHPFVETLRVLFG